MKYNALITVRSLLSGKPATTPEEDTYQEGITTVLFMGTLAPWHYIPKNTLKHNKTVLVSKYAANVITKGLVNEHSDTTLYNRTLFPVRRTQHFHSGQR